MFDRAHKDWKKLVSDGLMVGLLVLALGLMAACAPAGDGGSGGPYGGEATDVTSTEPPMEGEEAEVVMRSSTFQPEEITVAPGTTITWTNEDSFQHTVTSGTRENPTDMFDETVPGGGSFSFTFEDPATYEYFCRIHPGMRGVVVVE